MRLGKFVKAPNERKRYSIDYDDWLDTGETISSVVFTVDPADELAIASSSISSRSLAMFIEGGDANQTYSVTVQITTSLGQIKEDTVTFAVRDD
jgi:hypothetical protein